MLRKILTVIVVLGAIGYLAGLRACQQVPAAIGAASNPKSLPTISHDQHPHLAESQRSSMHGGAHNWDINTYPGPLGHNTTAKHRKFSNIIGVAPNISFDSQGRLITVSIKLNSIELHLLDPETLETIAMLELPPKASPSDNSGGGYFHIDAQGPCFSWLQPTTPSQSTRLRESPEGPKWNEVMRFHTALEGYVVVGAPFDRANSAPDHPPPRETSAHWAAIQPR